MMHLFVCLTCVRSRLCHQLLWLKSNSNQKIIIKRKIVIFFKLQGFNRLWISNWLMQGQVTFRSCSEGEGYVCRVKDWNASSQKGDCKGKSMSVCLHMYLCMCVQLHESVDSIGAEPKTQKWGKILNFNEIVLSCLVHWHHAEWEKIPGCSALVIFSSDRTGYHPRSQKCWGVCAPFRADLNKTWKIDTEPAAMYEYQCHLWQSRMADWEISVHYEFWIGVNYFTLSLSDDLFFPMSLHILRGTSLVRMKSSSSETFS